MLETLILPFMVTPLNVQLFADMLTVSPVVSVALLSASLNDTLSVPLSQFGVRIFYNRTLLKKLTGLPVTPV